MRSSEKRNWCDVVLQEARQRQREQETDRDREKEREREGPKEREEEKGEPCKQQQRPETSIAGTAIA